MSVLLLVRHAAHDNVGGFLAGRTDVRLGEAGRDQAQRLAAALAGEGITSLRSSPRERCRHTAEAIGAAAGALELTVDPRLDEIDFGHWAGHGFDHLDADREWRRWNAARSLAHTPAGDRMRHAQGRVLDVIEELAEGAGGERPALVTHADVIKAAVCFYLGMGLDAWPRFDIAPASLTRIELQPWGARVLTLNELPA